MLVLWQRCFRKSRRPVSPDLRRYFSDVFLNHPWFDPQLAPLVALQHGEIVGFLGRMARPMRFRGRPIRCAIATQLMVDPDRRCGFAAIDLLRALHAGPQDLCYSDGANVQAQRIWQRLGGEASRLMSLEWTRVLHPVQNVVNRASTHRRLTAMADLIRLPAAGVDKLLGATLAPLTHKPPNRAQRQPASPQQIMALFQQTSTGVALRPDYGEGFEWLLSRTAEARRFGPLRCTLVSEQTRPVGWFIYFAPPHRPAYLLQMGALPGRQRLLIDAMLRDAWECKASSITGQMEPQALTDLTDARCTFRCCTLSTLIHSPHPELLAAIHRGDAFLSRLDGEWWIRLGIDRMLEW